MVKRAPADPETSVPSAPAGGASPEVARLLRPQPPVPIPRRTYDPPPVGLLARTLLGDRVIKS